MPNISCIQMNIIASDLTANVSTAARLIAQAAETKPDLILLPELFSSGFDLPNAYQQASSLDQGAFAFLAESARKYHCFLAGSALESSPQGIYNTLAVYTPSGNLAGTYRKIHLFHPMQEDAYLQPGNEVCIIPTSIGNLGLAICYDLRYPELFRCLALRGADCILLSAEWPLSRIEHWRILLQARAIENQLFFVAANCLGINNTSPFGGHSAILDPFGSHLVQAETQECVISAQINLPAIHKARRLFSTTAEARTDLFPLMEQ